MDKSGTQTLQTWLNAASRRLGDAGVGTPRYDAERLAAFVLGVTWSGMWSVGGDRRLDDDVVARLESVLLRRAGGEPLAYIEGSRGFYGLELACGPGVLVPRPETELLVDVALELISGVGRPVVIDLGTGSGAIALAIASQRPEAEIVATDISADALAFARRNARDLGFDVWFAEGDLYEAVPMELRGRVDLIVSNPPYVPVGAGVGFDVRAEPSVAVFGGEVGNDVLERVVATAPRWLRSGGAVALEIGAPYQADVLEGAEVRSDIKGDPRVIWRRF